MTELKVGTKLHVREFFTFYDPQTWLKYACDIGSEFEILEVFPEPDGPDDPPEYTIKVLEFTRGHSAEFSKRGAQQAPAGTEFTIDEEWIEKHCEVLGE